VSSHKPPHPWLFALTGIPYGVSGTFSGAVMPFLANRNGVKLDAIGWYGTLLLVPAMFQFVYAPLVDIGPKRKHWLVGFALASALCLAGAFVVTPRQTVLFLVLAFIGQLFAGLVGACNGGLLATSIPDEKRGSAAAALNIGNLSGGAVSAALVIWMVAQELPTAVIAAVIIAMSILPALAVLSVTEPAREAGRTLGQVFGAMWTDVRTVLFSRSGLTGVALCISPVGTAALANYFSGMGGDYHASDGWVAFVNGPGNVVPTAIGAFVGGWLCDQYNRRAIYLLSGALTAACGLVMAFSPRVELTYIVGVITYYLITGFCYSAFTATVLETIGDGAKSASTQYAVFVAAGNAAIAYVGLVDTRFAESHGVEGVIKSDALLNIAGVVVLGLVFWKLKSFGKRGRKAAATA
jgi:MFS family permease